MVVFVLDFVSIRSDQHFHVYCHLALKTKPLDNSLFPSSVHMHVVVLTVTYFVTHVNYMSQVANSRLTVPSKLVLHKL